MQAVSLGYSKLTAFFHTFLINFFQSDVDNKILK